MSQDLAVINKSMAKFAPELASKYATYPLENSRWLFPQESLPGNVSGFVAAHSNIEGIKQDYVYGRTDELGSGYYHLLTRVSYQLLSNRMRSEAPPAGCCSCNKEAKQELDMFDRVKRIVYNRSVASVPNDAIAAEDAIKGARVIAQKWHHALQNEQLIIGGIQLATL